MIEPTDEMIEAFNRGKQSGGFGTGTAGPGPGIAAVLAIVERDRCMQPRGHVHHPLAKRQWPSGRGGSHPHFCVGCSDGEVPGPGCGDCRSTGMDQTPWPSCAGCGSPAGETREGLTHD